MMLCHGYFNYWYPGFGNAMGLSKFQGRFWKFPDFMKFHSDAGEEVHQKGLRRKWERKSWSIIASYRELLEHNGLNILFSGNINTHKIYHCNYFYVSVALSRLTLLCDPHPITTNQTHQRLIASNWTAMSIPQYVMIPHFPEWREAALGLAVSSGIAAVAGQLALMPFLMFVFRYVA